ncbi:asparagine synthase (glutamine-hydrolyzing) [Sphingomonas sp. BE123]|uniref:asparagine synthetase B family protein n=1 Tax=Sphingomonas sp. BE123 TaxID=2817842 RepID=UPI0028658627|nr:asparagine synthetase B [Sphingomonas sp. BE123]MDR6850817.1 asparagine synthase (glutamine-hydrolyzing) [Sphingomonas sp. BE123]
MTGICGVWRFDGQSGAAPACDRIGRALAIYGPDRAGSWADGPIALGCRLARLLPEDRYDRQPLISDDGRIVLVADVRLDNRSELAEALDLASGDLAQMADADLLLRTWLAWGPAAIDRLIGEFAFAVWDGDAQRLTLVRDFIGCRPLFYHQGDGWIGFASMVKGLHALPEVPIAADKTTLQRYLALLPMQGAGSFYESIRRVEPGHFVEIAADGRVNAVRWYRPPPLLPDLADPSPYIAEVREIFERAVAARLRATGAISCTLSGGLDSAAVTATAAIQLAAAGRRLKAYTHTPMLGVPLQTPPNRFPNEGVLAARLAADHPIIDHVMVDSAARSIGDDLDQRYYYNEIPALNLCNELWVSEINKLAGGQRGNVLLTGAMGNLTISNEGKHGLNSLFYGGRLLAWARIARRVVRSGSMSVLGLAFFTALPIMPTAVQNALQRLFGRPGPAVRDYTLVRAAVMDAPQTGRATLAQETERFFNNLARGRRERILSALWQQEILTISYKGALARYGVDTRDPMSDRQLVDLCLALPHALFLHREHGRGLYQLAFADRIPAEIRLNQRRGSQGSDWAARLYAARERIADEAERSSASQTANALIDLDQLKWLATTIPDPDTADLDAAVVPYRYRLLRTLSVTHFLRRVEGGNH